MTTETPLDAAHAAMQAAPDDDGARLAFYAALADNPLFLLLEHEAEGDTIAPRVFDPEGERCVLAFDDEDRLARFTGAIAPYAALPGRVLCQMLEGQEISLGVNLDVAPSAILLPPEAVDWLADMLRHSPERIEARPEMIRRPGALPEALLAALETRLARVGGVMRTAWLVGVRYEDGEAGHLLACIDAAPQARDALAHAVAEALRFSGVEAGRLDVTFVAGDDALVAVLERHGIGFDLPRPERPRPERRPPGSDPDKPPRLR